MNNRTGLGLMVLVGLMAGLLAGCTLPVPRTSIAYQPSTRSVEISSPKDVSIGKVELLMEGTNVTLTVENYKSEIPIEVIKAAAEAQSAQIAAGQAAIERVISAAAGVK